MRVAGGHRSAASEHVHRDSYVPFFASETQLLPNLFLSLQNLSLYRHKLDSFFLLFAGSVATLGIDTALGVLASETKKYSEA